MNELKPCPFCGSTTSLEMAESNYPNDKYVVCNFNKGGCGGSTGSGDSDEEAIQKWNHREAQRWIPVGERWPNRDSVHDVIVRSTDNPTFQRRAVAVPFLNGEFSVTKHASCEYVSHWKALPEMPEFTAGDQQ